VGGEVLGDAAGEHGHRRQIGDRHPVRPEVRTRRVLELGSGHGAELEVVARHEEVLVLAAVDAGAQVLAHRRGDETGFLPQLARRGLRRALAVLDPTAREVPPPPLARRLHRHQQDLVPVDDDRAGASVLEHPHWATLRGRDRCHGDNGNRRGYGPNAIDRVHTGVLGWRCASG
jgi:hypothetical protein